MAKPMKIVNLILRLGLPKKNRDENQIPRKDHTQSGNIYAGKFRLSSLTPGVSQRKRYIRQEAQQIGNKNTKICDLIIFSFNGVDSTLIISDELEVLTLGDIFENDHNDLKVIREELEWDEEVEY